MNKRNVLILLLFVVFSSKLMTAGSVGISPIYYKEFFEPGLEKTFEFYASNTNTINGVDVYVKGDLAEYINLSETHLLDNKKFSISMKLPERIEKPGTHHIYIGVIESSPESGGNIGGIAGIEARIDILVPYPGKYTESTFNIRDVNEGEDLTYEIEIQNLGLEEVQVSPSIEIYKNNMTEKIFTENLPESTMKLKSIRNIGGKIDGAKFQPGEHQALAIIDWGEETTRINKTFRIGEFLIEITDYDYQFEKDTINQFNLEISNKWNTKIDRVFADIIITDEGRVVNTFRTISVDTNPWEVKNITGFFDAKGLDAKRYTAAITLSYGDKKTGKLVAIYINDVPSEGLQLATIISIAVGIIILIIILILVVRIKKLQSIIKKNGKKKK